MEIRVGEVLYSKLGNENPDAGHIKCPRGPHLARGPQVPHKWMFYQAERFEQSRTLKRCLNLF